MQRFPKFVSTRTALPAGGPSYRYLSYSSFMVRKDVHDVLMDHLRAGVRLPRRLLDVVRGTGGQVLKHRGRVAGYVFDYVGYATDGYLVSYREGAYRVYPESELIGRRHPLDFADGCAVLVSSEHSGDRGMGPQLVSLHDVHRYMVGGDCFDTMVRVRDYSLFSYYWYAESDLAPEPFETEGGHVWNLPQVRRVVFDLSDFPDWEEEEEEREPGRGGWDCGIGNHNLKRRYDGPVIGVELEVDADDRRELGELCASVGIHTCRDGSLDDSKGIELVSAPLDWRELRGESSPWGRVFAGGGFNVNDPDGYGIHVSLNRRAISRGAQARMFYALHRWTSLERVLGRGGTSYARKYREGRSECRKSALSAVNNGTDKYVAANLACRERMEVRCIAATSDWREFRARVGLIDALRLFAEYAGWGMFTGDAFRAFMRERLIDSHPEAVAAYCGVSRRSGRPLVASSEVN